MSSGIRVLGLVALLSAGPVVGEPTVHTSEEWRADLRFLVEAIHEHHGDPFHTVSREELETRVAALDSRIPELTDAHVVVEMARIVALIHDGHTALKGWQKDADLGFSWYPILPLQLEDGLFVIAAAPEYRELVGSEIVEIGETPAQEGFEIAASAQAVDNPQSLREWGRGTLQSPQILSAVGLIETLNQPFLVEKKGRRWRPTIEPRTGEWPGTTRSFMTSESGWHEVLADQRPLWLSGLERSLDWHWIEDESTLWIQHHAIRHPEGRSVGAFYAEALAAAESHGAEKLVIDLRLNTGGNNFLNRPVIRQLLRTPYASAPGRLWVIIGGRTFSAAQNLVNELENYTDAIFVGQPTGQRINFWGDARRLLLPNSQLPLSVSFAWWQDMPPWDRRIWTEPSVYAAPTLADLAAGRDPVAEAIFEGSFLDLASAVPERLQSDGAQATAEWLSELKEQTRFKYIRFETNLNRLGYSLSDDEARSVFELNTRLHPDSPNVWDSLAEWHLNARELDVSERYYRRALAVDPEFANATRMLAEVDAAREQQRH